MSPGSSTESYPAFARIGLRENPGKNLNQVTCPDRDSNPSHLVSRPDALTVTPQVWTITYVIGISLETDFAYDPMKCPSGATGQYAYRPDCRQFLNCWKGRGIVQVCAPGTLFNPDTRECDFPSKVKCLETTQDDRWSNIEPDITVERRSGREGRMLGNTPAPWNAVRPVVQPPTSAPQVKKDCPMAGGTGLAPHPTDCRKFFNCWMGTAHTQQCGPGTLFNPRTLVCDFPYNVVCATTTSTTTTTPTNIGHLIRESRLAGPTLSPRHAINSNSGKSTTTSTTTTTTAAPITRGKVDCPMPGGTGFAPHPTDCSKYLNCWRGTAHTQQCGPGTLFNPQTLVCDFPYNVNCVTSTSSTAEGEKEMVGSLAEKKLPTEGCTGRNGEREKSSG
ncbi:hypothetical protein ANN_03395 [Periplaneta americana]|uniref:Chitin-binding type-2 domain-containing protein n=1 Tax=Periplaneta americana TaxID=6978 RepID=A0ABQ8TYX4_PERAM|nr:hypothetical protein ANN_03395 [Periplaneta americana]